MFMTIALAALTVSPAQGGELKLTNVRLTIGELGPARPSAKFLPGDLVFVGYDINGLSIEPNGDATYKMAMEVFDGTGKSIFKQAASERKESFPLRGNLIPARAFVTLGLDFEPGNYTCKITVEDPKTKASDTLTAKFEVLKRDFGIVAVYTSHDLGGRLSAPATGLVGQTTFIQFSVTGFQRDPKFKQPNVHFTFQVLDDKGNAILGKPQQHFQDDKALDRIDENFGAFGMRFMLFMSRPGKFTVQLTAEDKLANKKSVYELPVTVLAGN
jgi:hypothetical protein